VEKISFALISLGLGKKILIWSESFTTRVEKIRFALISLRLGKKTFVWPKTFTAGEKKRLI